MITFRNVGTKIAGAMLFAGLTASAGFAANGFTMNLTLPESVSVGNTVLAAGPCKITEIKLENDQSAFLFRDDQGHTAVVTGAKTAQPDDVNSSDIGQRSEVVLTSDEDGTKHLDQMFIEGESTGYRFLRLQ